MIKALLLLSGGAITLVCLLFLAEMWPFLWVFYGLVIGGLLLRLGAEW